MKNHAVVTLKSYFIGFILSLLLTLTAFFLTMGDLVPKNALSLVIVSLAVIQAVVQLVFFFHLQNHTSSYWNEVVFLFMLTIVGIVVFGTLWIMYNLDYLMMPSMKGIK